MHNSNKNKIFTIGTDPEFMLETLDGHLKSAVGRVKGTKHKPQVLPNGASLSYDNVNIEFATKVAGSMKDFVSKIQCTFNEVYQVIPKGMRLKAYASAQYPLAELQSDAAKEAGCDPDFNAWTGEVNERPDLELNPRLRSCGGHIHVGQKIGYDFLLDPYGKLLVVQTMDAILGTISVVLDKSMMARNRRELYGKAGCHRPTEYGVEYRVLSNFWLKNDTLVKLMYSLTKDALNIIDKGEAFNLIDEIGSEKLVNYINKSWTFEAKDVVDKILPRHISNVSQYFLKEAIANDVSINNTTLEHSWNLRLQDITA